MLREGVFHPSMLTPELLKHFTLPFATPPGPEELQQASLALNHHQTEDLVPYLGKVTCQATFLWGQHDRYLVPYWGGYYTKLSQIQCLNFFQMQVTIL